ncbi:hypothetical protein B4109_0240 [Geobacillus stearothermophilus]|uniref:Uncharacterized protein n=1 Tax=Geobacillus stearothermophilus TaxID=1422 RepID=A0A150M4Y6_GEOSE|nr:hypothetical protein B4109_0240 [Geobacillus stearothermophilus]
MTDSLCNKHLTYQNGDAILIKPLRCGKKNKKRVLTKKRKDDTL